MPQIIVKTEIDADIDTCFDLARDVGFYYNTLEKFTEIPISDKVTGLMEAGDYVTWETNHLSLMQHLTLKVTEFEKPILFVDEMVRGEFKTYRHEHIFEVDNDKTVMIDKFEFQSPYGIFGKLVDWVFLKRHFKKLIITRNKTLRLHAEAKMQD